MENFIFCVVETEENNAEEDGSLSLSGEKIEETPQGSDISTEIGAAGFLDMEYGNDLVSSESTRKRRMQVLNMLKNH